MVDTHEGGCLCGTVRYRVVGQSTRAVVCHCRFCQRRTGSAFAISVYFAEQDVAITQGILNTYEYRSDESKRWLRMEFCPTCGTSVTWTVEFLPGERAIAGGTLDDPNWLKLKRHVWTRSAQHWMVFPPEVELLETTLSQYK
ncbi:MAG: GFA family protein [Deltaproteobacteria bacterium]|nr:GFA family protein [Deltaproteobacteria bacterium]